MGFMGKLTYLVSILFIPLSVIFVFVTVQAHHIGNGIRCSDNGEINWMLMPSGSDDVQLAILSGLEPKDIKELTNLDDIRFFLYSRENRQRAEVGVMNHSCMPQFTYFNPKRPTKVLVHGFGDAVRSSYMVPLLKEAFLERDEFNILAVDWGPLAATPWYNAAASNTRDAAKHTAKLIDYLSESTGARAEDFHIVGFSLGAHVAGMTSQFVRRGKVRRVTGLDPAQVLFTSTPNDYRLDPTDADVVEVVHTSGGYLSFDSPVGHRDFFPNGGFWPQPGCNMDIVATCSHRRAYYYYAEAIKTGMGFKGVHCDTWEAFRDGNCTENKKKSEMWNDEVDNSAHGTFYLHTNPEEPYANHNSSSVPHVTKA